LREPINKFWVKTYPVVGVGSVGVGVLGINTGITGVGIAIGFMTEFTLIEYEELLLPFMPVHFKEYVVFTVGDTTRDPLKACVPDHPRDAVQLVAFMTDQVMVAGSPRVIVLGFMRKLTAGIPPGNATESVTDLVTIPPVPVQARE